MTDSGAGRRLISRREALILALLLLAAWGAMRAAAERDGCVAVVTLDGREILRYNLADYHGGRTEVSLWESHGVPVHFVLEAGGIRFENVDCPDKLCEGMGVCSGEYDRAVCLPNKTAVAVYAPGDVPAAPK